MHAQLPSAVTPGQRERQSLRAKQVLGWGLVLFAALQALWLVRRFGVNVVIWDEWAWVREMVVRGHERSIPGFARIGELQLRRKNDTR